MSDRIPDAILVMMAKKFACSEQPTRLAILHTLMKGKEKNVGQVVTETGRNEVIVSRHLKQLANAKMVIRWKEGLQVFLPSQ